MYFSQEYFSKVYFSKVHFSKMYLSMYFSKKKRKVFLSRTTAEVHSKLSKSTAVVDFASSSSSNKEKVSSNLLPVPPSSSHCQHNFTSFNLHCHWKLHSTKFKKKISCNFYFRLYDAHIVRSFEAPGAYTVTGAIL